MLDAIEHKIEQFIADLGDSDAQMLLDRLVAGKRLRAKLILIIAGSDTKAIKTAAIVEMIHAASLLHDDVLDNADIRRGKASINSEFDDKTAIMFGDVLYSKGFYELIDINRDVAKVISEAVVRLSLGERRDIILSESFSPNKESYMEMIDQKTAALIQASSEAAAILSGKERGIYRIYGRNLGIAFQMIDDILDITQDSDKLGKPTMQDFVEGKTTLPYIYLYEALNNSGRDRLISLHGRKLNKGDQVWIREQMDRYNVIEHSRNEASVLIDEAIELMDQAGESSLERIARSMIERDF